MKINFKTWHRFSPCLVFVLVFFVVFFLINHAVVALVENSDLLSCWKVNVTPISTLLQLLPGFFQYFPELALSSSKGREGKTILGLAAHQIVLTMFFRKMIASPKSCRLSCKRTKVCHVETLEQRNIHSKVYNVIIYACRNFK